ncbi:MAG: hypothetical protein A2Y54_01800 [Chloroflexi bacterium RBG_16_51_16]|nr:MAG: hypothetical protein A2Y54_01800 [Chloroflexi bacterium RBG_16_51_16]
MPALNRIQLIGRLGRDPENRFTPTGKNVTHFSIAVSNRWKGRDGVWKDATDWVNIEAWGRLGEVCTQYLHKGSLIYLEGRLKTDKYQSQGETKYFSKVVMNGMQMLDKKQAEEPADDEMMAVEEAEGEYEIEK